MNLVLDASAHAESAPPRISGEPLTTATDRYPLNPWRAIRDAFGDLPGAQRRGVVVFGAGLTAALIGTTQWLDGGDARIALVGGLLWISEWRPLRRLCRSGVSGLIRLSRVTPPAPSPQESSPA